MTYAVVDVETGGVNPFECALLQIGCIVCDDDFNVLEEFCTYVKPGFNSKTGEALLIEKEALNINKINLDDLADAPLELEALSNLNKVLSKHNVDTYLGFNLFFDLLFLKSCAFRNRAHLYGSGMALDIQMTCRNVEGLYKYSLKAVAEHFGITNDKAHDALSDCRATKEIAKRVLCT